MNDEAKQIKECQAPGSIWHFEQRKKSGEFQVYCMTCRRWQFEKDKCLYFKSKQNK